MPLEDLAIRDLYNHHLDRASRVADANKVDLSKILLHLKCDEYVEPYCITCYLYSNVKFITFVTLLRATYSSEGLYYSHRESTLRQRNLPPSLRRS